MRAGETLPNLFVHEHTNGREDAQPPVPTTYVYSRSQTRYPTSELPATFGFGTGALMMCSRSPSKRQKRVCSVSTQARFHATSTLVMNFSPSSRNLPVYADMDRNAAACSSSAVGGLGPSAVMRAKKRPADVNAIYPLG